MAGASGTTLLNSSLTSRVLLPRPYQLLRPKYQDSRKHGDGDVNELQTEYIAS